MRVKNYLLTFLACGTFYFVQGAAVDTVTIYSQAMHKNLKCVVILPDAYAKADHQFPVVYLLHGYGGNYANWIQRVPSIKEQADRYNFLIVCPDGAIDSWYLNSPVDSAVRYQTFVGIEVPHFIDSAYRTRAKRQFRAISGLSMGGQGALRIAFAYPKTFGAAGSMSGVQNLVPFKGGYHLTLLLGDTLQNDLFRKYSVVNIARALTGPYPALIIDCGVSDPFIETNRELNRILLERKIPHDYTERNGTHNWDYWANSIRYHLLFFSIHFHRERGAQLKNLNKKVPHKKMPHYTG